jgi:predicted nuclease of restriction endonuclease-like (RecB) superfamily
LIFPVNVIYRIYKLSDLFISNYQYQSYCPALYWDIGRDIAEKQDESWGQSIVPVFSGELQKEFPGISGFSVSNLWSMAQFYTEYHDVEFLQPLVGEISWTKHIAILNKCKDNQERRFVNYG